MTLSAPIYALPNPAATLCVDSGYTIVENQCKMPNGRFCELWQFWRGDCQPQYHICTKAGGQLIKTKAQTICQIKQTAFTWEARNQGTKKQSKWTVVLIPAQQSASALPTP